MATAWAVIVALALALLLRIVVYQPFTIPSASMEPGLVEGDYIVVSKFRYGWSRAALPFSPPIFRGRIFGQTPERGDIIVFKSEASGEAIIKRVIGLPGDRVQVREGRVVLNGAALPQGILVASGGGDDPAIPIRESTPEGRRYVTLDRGSGREGDNTDVFVVPARRYFVLGDNRDDSLDSRWPAGVGQGFVPAENIVGEAQLILLSWKPGASLLKPWTWLSLRPGRTLKALS